MSGTDSIAVHKIKKNLSFPFPVTVSSHKKIQAFAQTFYSRMEHIQVHWIKVQSVMDPYTPSYESRMLSLRLMSPASFVKIISTLSYWKVNYRLNSNILSQFQ